METKKQIKTNIKFFDDNIKLLKEGDLVMIASYCPIWNTQLFINLALEIGKTTDVMFLSCKYEMETIEKYFAKTILNRKLYGDKLPIEKVDLQKSNLELNKLKLKLEASKYFNYHKIWNETIGEICGEDKNLKVLFIDQIDYLYLKKGWDLEKNLKKLAKYAKVEKICIVINCAIPALKKLKIKKLYEMNFLKRMNIQHAYFDKIIALHKDEYFGINEDVSGKSTHGMLEFNILFSRDESENHYYGYVGTNWKIDFDKFN